MLFLPSSSFYVLWLRCSWVRIPLQEMKVCDPRHFAWETYICDCERYIDVESFCSMPSNGYATTIYDTRNGINCNNVFGTWIWRWTRLVGWGPILRSNHALHVDMLFIQCVPKYGNARRLLVVANRGYEKLVDAMPDLGLFCVYWAQPYD